MWIQLNEEEAELMKQLLRHQVHELMNDDAKRLLSYIECSAEEASQSDPYREAAYKHRGDDFGIDEDALVSNGADKGAWVHAWIWITDDEAGLSGDNEDDEDE